MNEYVIITIIFIAACWLGATLMDTYDARKKKRYHCPMCDRPFSSRGKINVHLQNAHGVTLW